MIFLVVALIDHSEDIDFVVTVDANTPQQALDYCLVNGHVSPNQEVKVVQPTIYNAQMHRIYKG